jgi:hypothetical protein
MIDSGDDLDHIYLWLDNNEKTEDPVMKQVWKFLDFRTKSAMYQYNNKDEIKGLLVFCKYKDKPFMMTGASRLGDVWLSSKTELDHGNYPNYDHRVLMNECSEFSYKIRTTD